MKKPTSVSINELGDWLQVSAQRVRQMSKDGEMPPVDNLMMDAYATCKALALLLVKSKGKNKVGPAKERLVKAQADMQELKLRKASGDLLDRHAVGLVVSGMAIELRRVLQGMDLTTEQRETISRQLSTLSAESVLTRIQDDLEEEADAQDEDGDEGS